MKILFMDVTTAQGTLGYANTLKSIEATWTHPHPQEASSWLIPSIHTFLQEQGVTLADLDALYCTRGPGSFTGIRVGLATALGLAQGLAIPIYGLTTFECYEKSLPEAVRQQKPVIILIDSKRGDFFAQRYEQGEPVGDPFITTSDQLDFSQYYGIADTLLEGTTFLSLHPLSVLENLQGIALSSLQPTPFYLRDPSITLAGHHGIA